MAIVITYAEKGGVPQVHTFEALEITLGRGQENDLVLKGQNVSKRHARIVIKDDKYIVVDLKSTNGTFVNHKRISAPQVVRRADKVSVGDYHLAVGVGADPTPDHRAAPELLEWIVTLDGPDGRQQFALQGDVTVGRSSSCEIQLSHKNVGRRQMRILPFSRYVAVNDLGTALGTWVNGERLNGSCRLTSSDDVVEFAGHHLWVHRPGEEPPTEYGRPGHDDGPGWKLLLQGFPHPELVKLEGEPILVGADPNCRVCLAGQNMPAQLLRFDVNKAVLEVELLAAAPNPITTDRGALALGSPVILEAGERLQLAPGLSILVQFVRPQPAMSRPEVTVPRLRVGRRKTPKTGRPRLPPGPRKETPG